MKSKHPGKALNHKFPPKEAVQVKCEVCGKPAIENHVMCETCREETHLIGIYHNANIMTRRFGHINYAGETRFTLNYRKGKKLFEQKTGKTIPTPEPGVRYSSGSEVCLFCGNPEQVRIKPDGSDYRFKPRKGREFVCSQCVQMFLDHDQEYLQKLLAIATASGWENQVKAIETFIPEETIDDRKTKKPKRNMERKRSMRKFRPARHKVRA